MDQIDSWENGGFMAVIRLAVIDVGSYELNMEIFDISSKSGIVLVDRISHMIGIGKDTYTDGRIRYALLDEMCKILGKFTSIMKEYHVNDYQAFTTSAVREAKNNTLVLDQIRVRTGLHVSVLSNSEQRFICYKAVASKKNMFNKLIEKGTAFIDIGSGSIQISLFDKKTLVTTQNIKLGSLRIRETLMHVADTVNFKRLISELVDNDIQTFKKLFLKDREIKNIIGVGDSLFYFIQKVKKERESFCITVAEFQELYDSIIGKSVDTISEYLDMPTEYASLVIPSMMVYKKILDETDAEIIWIPDVNLCNGIVADYADKKKIIPLEHNFNEDILEAARNIGKRYMTNKGHAQILESNVVKIFDCMKPYHGLSKRERLLLQIAAILHDCGKYISMGVPGECSYHIIMNTEIIGLSHRDREMVANIVKYNTLDFTSYEDFEGKVSEQDYLIIMKLTAILRIGNAMDRSHKQKFKNLKTAFKNQKLIITTETLEDITLERGLFEQKADFFEEVYGIRPVLKQKRGAL